MDESRLWMIFTAVCLASLIGLLEYEGMINLIGEDESKSSLYDTSDEVHALGYECLENHDVVMHFHPYLTIIIDGEELVIPTNTGIDTDICPNAMHMTHTHDATGKIHVEGHQEVDVPLEVFFDVWGKHFDEAGIFDYRDGSIQMTVDGVNNTQYEKLVLADGQNIVITYTSN